MKTTTTTLSRYLLGILFIVFGLDGFFHFIPIPPARPDAQRLIGALIDTGYFFQMVKLLEVGCGILLVANRLVPLALVLLAPILVGITSIHLFLNPEGIPLMAFLLFVHQVLVRRYWSYFAPVLALRASPQQQLYATARTTDSP